MAEQINTGASGAASGIAVGEPQAAESRGTASAQTERPSRDPGAAAEAPRAVPDRELLLQVVEELYDRLAAERRAAGTDVTSVLPLLTDEVIAAHKTAAQQPAAQAAGAPAAGEAVGTPVPAPPLPRVNAIWDHPLFQRQYRALHDFERDRPFCHHGIAHLLDVARLAWIENFEQHLGFDRELVYAAALLHDVGKAEQYRSGIPHEIAGEKIASGILATLPDDASFTVVEARQILVAIRGHRHLRPDATPLERLIYMADKRSRACFACRAADRCKWAPEKRVNHIAW